MEINALAKSAVKAALPARLVRRILFTSEFARFGRMFEKQRRSKAMNQDNRVLIRMGARELSQQEVEAVTGAFRVRHTLTPCFVDSKQQLLNGDQNIGECGP